MSKEHASSDTITTKTLGLIGRLPHFGRDTRLSNIKKANRYLGFQEKRIMNMLSSGNKKGALLTWLMLLKISHSYQILLFNRVYKGWYYKIDREIANKLVLKAINKLRNWDLKLLINRFYIVKRSGKLRPIGAPNFESRMISKCLTDIVYAFTVNRRSPEQHGYMKARGTWSAILQVINLLKEGYKGYEFDLKSFFNVLTPAVVEEGLRGTDKLLKGLIITVLRKIEYRFTKLEEEVELVPSRKGVVRRFGLPQGLSLSPY